MKEKILNWLCVGECGSSSKAMAFAALGMPNNGSHPYDPDDLNRCILLLDMVPEIRQHMDRVASINGTWALLVARWQEVEQCFIDEVGFNWSKGKRAPRTYQIMKDIGC
jgi:hypothetical protein